MIESDAFHYPLTKAEMQTGEFAEAKPSEQPRIDPTMWVDLHGDYLFKYAMMRLRDDSLAEDAVQETMLAAIKSMSAYGGQSSERTWLTSILKHKIIDHFRKSSKMVQFTDEDLDLTGVNKFFERNDAWDGHWQETLRPVDIGDNPEELLERGELWAVMQKCMSGLPTRVADVFSLREMEGLTSDEICEVFGLSPNNFWVIMHRARMLLRRCIEINWFRKVA